VKSSVGHIRDLPTSGSGKLHGSQGARGAGGEDAQDVARRESPLQGAEGARAAGAAHGHRPGARLGSELRDPARQGEGGRRAAQLADKADTIYLATDLDREGEAIAWHLREAIGGDDERFQRVVFNEITQARPSRRPLPTRRGSTRHGSTPSRRGASSIASSATWCRRCCGPRWPAACPPVACSPSPCAWSSSASVRSAPSCPRSTGRSTRTSKVRRGRTGKASRCAASAARSSARGTRKTPWRPAMRWRRAAYGSCRTRGQADAVQAARALHHLDAAAGREHAPGLQRQEDHDPGAAPLRGRATSPTCGRTRRTCQQEAVPPAATYIGRTFRRLPAREAARLLAPVTTRRKRTRRSVPSDVNRCSRRSWPTWSATRSGSTS
jgi:hypothetical protein